MSDVTTADSLRSAARHNGSREALVDGFGARDERRRINYSELLDRAERGALALASRYAKGTHIAVWAPNSTDWIILQMASALAGLPLVVLNANLRPPEIAYILKNSHSAAVFTAQAHRGTHMPAVMAELQPSLPALESVFRIEALSDLPIGTQPLPSVHADDLALLLYTSGTTGAPKGVMLSHRSITTTGRAGAELMRLSGDARWLLTLPLASVGGCVFPVMGALANHSTMVVMRDFDAALAIRLIDEEKISFFNAPTTVHLRLLDHPAATHASFSSLKTVTCGGSTVAAALIERIEHRFGAECLMNYGLTETSGSVTLIRPGESLDRKCNTVGRPIPGVEVEIRSESGASTPANEIGEICVRSPGNMSGYFGMPEATAATIDELGWLRTGDLGHMDGEGFVSISGRLKDMIKRAGYNVYPREIEDLLAAHPAIKESAIFGVPHPELGEEIAAAIILRADQWIGGDALQAWLSTQIARQKIPRLWHFLDSFPTNANGKVQKFELRRRFAAP